MILLYLTEGKSFAGTSAITNLIGKATLSKPAVFKRMRNSAAWLRWLCANIRRRAGLLTPKPRWLKDKNVTLVDGSEVVKSGQEKRYHMPHYSLDLFALDVRELLVTDRKTGEKLANFKRVGKGEVVMGDRIYGTLPGIAYLRERGADYALRINSRGFHLINDKNQEINLKKRLSQLKEGKIADIRGRCKIKEGYEPIRICAYRKDAESEKAGLKRIRKSNQRKHGGRPVSDEQRENNKYILIATSLGKEATAAQVLELYRARWQIEMAFKRLKSLFQYGNLPAKDGESARAWFYGKLLLAALCETLVNTGRFSPSGPSGE